jgi:DNA-directed RNA polymerase specialized sigma24 family protein
LDYVELDALLARIYEQVVTKRHTLRTNERYASWVSVVCHNLFVNYVRSGRPVLIHGLRGASLMSLPKEEAEEDVVVLFRAITSAIERLPGYLRPIAELRLVHERSYEEIAFLLDKNVVVVRSYVNKALNRLRQDPYFMAFCRIHYEEELERVATASGSSVSENSG